MAILLLAACGVKKTAVPAEADKASEPIAESHTSPSPSLEERIASGEFAWLDTIQIDTVHIDCNIIHDSYLLSNMKEQSDGNSSQNMNYSIDSLVFLRNGYYYLYNSQLLVDYGRYCTTRLDTIEVCIRDKMARWENIINSFEIFTFYSYNSKIEKYITYVGSMGIVLCFEPNNEIKFCDIHNAKKSLSGTSWRVSNKRVWDNIERNQRYIDSSYQNALKDAYYGEEELENYNKSETKVLIQ